MTCAHTPEPLLRQEREETTNSKAPSALFTPSFLPPQATADQLVTVCALAFSRLLCAGRESHRMNPFVRSLGTMVLRGMTAAVSLGTAEPVSVSFCLLTDIWDVCRFWLPPTKLPWAFRPESPCNVSASLLVNTGVERLNGRQYVPAPTEPIPL